MTLAATPTGDRSLAKCQDPEASKWQRPTGGPSREVPTTFPSRSRALMGHRPLRSGVWGRSACRNRWPLVDAKGAAARPYCCEQDAARKTRRVPFATVLLVAFALLAGPAWSQAATPGRNGRIAFTRFTSSSFVAR